MNRIYKIIVILLFLILPFNLNAHVQHYDNLNKIEFDIYRNNKHIGKHILISGFVHPPTEDRHITTLHLLGEQNLILIKGSIPASKGGSVIVSPSTKIISNPKQEASKKDEAPK